MDKYSRMSSHAMFYDGSCASLQMIESREGAPEDGKMTLVILKYGRLEYCDLNQVHIPSMIPASFLKLLHPLSLIDHQLFCELI